LVRSGGRDIVEIDGGETAEVVGREKIEIDGMERLELDGRETLKTARHHEVAVPLDDVSEPTELDSNLIETSTALEKKPGAIVPFSGSDRQLRQAVSK
jgi:hypothetical protein